MQRFRIVGYYLAGVAVIIALAVWGVSLRSTEAVETTTPDVAPPTLAEDHRSQSSSGSAQLPAPIPAEIRGDAKVSITDFRFVPEELTIAVGTTVTWMNSDDVPHTASSTSKPSVFDSKFLDTNEKYSFQFKTSGSYEYYCKVHPHMIGKIIVK